MNKVALITGGAVRIGRAIALGLAADGMDIAMHYNRSSEAAEALAVEIEATGVRCATFQADLGSGEAVLGLIPRVVEAMGSVSALINNASVYDPGTVLETTLELFANQMDVNFKAPFFLTQSFAKHVGEEGGSIINIVDTKVHFNQYPFAAYLLSKKALYELTRVTAAELAPRVRVNGVCPGMILPPDARPSAYIDARKERTLLKMAGNPEHIVSTVRFLLAHPYITGQCITVDGGESEARVGMNIVDFSDSSD